YQDLRMFTEHSKRCFGNLLDALATEQHIKPRSGIIQYEAKNRLTDLADQCLLAPAADTEVTLRIGQYQSTGTRQHAAEDQFCPVADTFGFDKVVPAKLIETTCRVRAHRRRNHLHEFLHLCVSAQQLRVLRSG